jgi:hypothetical protein
VKEANAWEEGEKLGNETRYLFSLGFQLEEHQTVPTEATGSGCACGGSWNLG